MTYSLPTRLPSVLAEYRDMVPRLYPSGAREHFVVPKMLGQDRIFDRAEECRMHAHRKQREQHQRNIMQPDADPADDHDADFRGLDEPDHPRLVAAVGQLPGERGKDEEDRKSTRLNSSH